VNVEVGPTELCYPPTQVRAQQRLADENNDGLERVRALNLGNVGSNATLERIDAAKEDRRSGHAMTRRLTRRRWR
jgi:hypothetical protein